jgi:polysaccharide export outer membrane protein
MSTRFLSHLTVAAMLLVGTVACQSPEAVVVAPSSGTPTPAAEQQYLIGPGDQLQISVWQHPDLSPAVVVLPDGEISLPLVGEIKATGLNEKDLAKVIKEKLTEYVRSPDVTVTVLNPASANFQQRIRITGAVMQPTSVPFRQGMTVMDVVLEAGGPNEFASANNTKLYRTTTGSTQVMPVYLDDILKKGKMETNYELQPSDVITIPERMF